MSDLTLTEALNRINQAGNSIVGGYNQLQQAEGALAHLHKTAWEYAGSSEGDAHAKAVRHHMGELRDAVERAREILRALTVATKTAAKVVDEADAKRRTARAHLNI